MKLLDGATADGYSNAFYCGGGNFHFLVEGTLDGTVTLKTAPTNANGTVETTAANYKALSANTTVTAVTSAGNGVKAGIGGPCWVSVQLSGVTTTDVDVELRPLEKVKFYNTGEAVS